MADIDPVNGVYGSVSGDQQLLNQKLIDPTITLSLSQQYIKESIPHNNMEQHSSADTRIVSYIIILYL